MAPYRYDRHNNVDAYMCLFYVAYKMYYMYIVPYVFVQRFAFEFIFYYTFVCFLSIFDIQRG